jgi:uncharacterized membrane-anchored protein YitT (DUF2179 family)
MSTNELSAPATEKHTPAEDALALVTGTLFLALAVMFLGQARLLTGGTAGMAFLLHYATGLGFGPAFFLLNLPFYWLAWRRMGTAFTVKTFAAVALLSAFSEWGPQVLQFTRVHPAVAAIAGGLLAGTGLLVLFRHRASLGGVGVLAVYLQERWGWRAGKVQMAVDVAIMLLALWLAEPQRVLYSLLGVVALNTVLVVNHKPGRYLGM